MASKELVYWISGETRYRIIDLLLATRSGRQLAIELGITPTAVNKYVYRRAYPSDEVIERALEIAAPFEKEKLLRIIADELLGLVERVYRELLSNSVDVGRYFLERLESIIEAMESGSIGEGEGGEALPS